MQSLIHKKVTTQAKVATSLVLAASSLVLARGKTGDNSSLPAAPASQSNLDHRGSSAKASAHLLSPKTEEAVEVTFGTLASLTLLAGSAALGRAQNRDPSCAARIAHRFSWVGWSLDSAAGMITLLAAHSWGLAAVRAAGLIANLTGTWYSNPVTSNNDPQISPSRFRAFINYAKDPKERANFTCLVLAVGATVYVAGLKLFGGNLTGSKYHIVAALGLLGYVFSSLPTLRAYIKSLNQPLPANRTTTVFKFFRDSPEVIAWPLASIVSIPLAFVGEVSWATVGWVVLPVVFNVSLAAKAWRDYARKNT